MDASQGFFTRSDGSFRAVLPGEIILKAEKLGDTEGYHFKGVASTGDKDREGEVLLQKGLDFEPFCEYGEFNWNHFPEIIVGVPTGKKAWFENGRWMTEGLIVKGMPISGNYTTDMVVQQHNQLKKAGLPRGLCQSVEGKVTERSECGKYVKKATIHAVALTFRPVNPNCTIGLLAKSMDRQVPLVCNDDLYRAALTPHQSQGTGRDLEAELEKAFLEGRLAQHLMGLKKGMTLEQAKARIKQMDVNKFLGGIRSGTNQ